MAPLDRAAISRHRHRNRLQSILILVGICGWMALVGWLTAGAEGVVWALLGTLALLLFQPVRSTVLLRALFGAVPLSPTTAPGLFALMRGLAERAGLEQVPSVLYIPRAELVALSTGTGSDAAIAVSGGLVDALPSRELAAVLAHEVSHHRHGDLRILRLADAAGRLTRFLSLFGLLSLAIFLPATMAGIKLPLLPLLLLAVAPIATDLLTLELSRTREFAADASAAEITGDAEGLMLALRRIDVLQGGGWERLGRPPSWLRLFRTHPTTAERLARLEELAPEPDYGRLPLPGPLLPDFSGYDFSRRRWPWPRPPNV
ncbi:MAG: zinc metalloprotease HtpX [Magnetospirillum sp.]|nr:zinc metalloprotease HtpX [Magnetospirillum sp.]